MSNVVEGQSVKVCSKCQNELPFSAFARQASSKDGLKYECRQCHGAYMAAWRAERREYLRRCAQDRWERMSEDEKVRKRQLDRDRYHADRTKHRDSYLRRYYGISVEQYAELMTAQGGRCAICGGDNGTKLLAVDHDHGCCPGVKSCGNCIRGLLCGSCNNGLGRFHDDVTLLSRAITYLTESS